MKYKNFREEFRAMYGHYPNLINYITEAGLMVGPSLYCDDKWPDSRASGVILVLGFFLVPLLVIILAIPVIIMAAIMGLLKK